MAVTVALLVAITSGDTSLPDARNATLVNSAVNSDPVAPSDTAAQCPVSVEEKYRAIMSAMNVDRYNELCAMDGAPGLASV